MNQLNALFRWQNFFLYISRRAFGQILAQCFFEFCGISSGNQNLGNMSSCQNLSFSKCIQITSVYLKTCLMKLIYHLIIAFLTACSHIIQSLNYLFIFTIDKKRGHVYITVVHASAELRSRDYPDPQLPAFYRSLLHSGYGVMVCNRNRAKSLFLCVSNKLCRRI